MIDSSNSAVHSAHAPGRGCPGPDNAFTPFERGEVEQSIATRFEAQAARRPAALALRDGVHEWNYGELNARANRIGRALLADTPAANESPAALLFEHGAPAVAAMLGVLKAARCYVALNPTHPAARLAAILEDCGAGVIVTNDRNATLARELARESVKIIPPTIKSPTIMSIDRLGDRLSAENLGLTIPPCAIAYILYTSGSTGKPKGVVQSNRNVLHNIMKYTNGVHLDAADRHALLPLYDVGASVSDIFGALLNGASLHPFDLRAGGFDRLADWLASERITVYHSVPTVFRRLVAALPEGASLPALRLLKLGGEATTVRDVELFRRHLPTTSILCASLGATEMNSIRMFFIDDATTFNGSIVPVGYEVADTEVVVLDEEGREIADGRAGEIAIRSEYLFCGYWRNPELTAAVLSTRPDGRRMFRTGDRGMILSDGCLVHLGRRESAVKVRGQYVETAEVEAALLANPAVREAAVAGRPDRWGETRLVAYVVGEASPAALRGQLGRTLPASMVPSAFVRLDSLPLTSNGKIDRDALPDPEPARSGAHPPRDRLELCLATIWEEVLKLRPVGIRDDFFELGGDSILALELVSQVESVCGQRLPISALLEAPTVARQAAILRDASWSPAWPAIVALQPHGDRPGFFARRAPAPTCSRWPNCRAIWDTISRFTACSLRGRTASERRYARWIRSPPISCARCARCSRAGRITWAARRTAVSWRSRWRNSWCAPERRSACWRCSTRARPDIRRYAATRPRDFTCSAWSAILFRSRRSADGPRCAARCSSSGRSAWRSAGASSPAASSRRKVSTSIFSRWLSRPSAAIARSPIRARSRYSECPRSRRTKSTLPIRCSDGAGLRPEALK